MLKNYFKTALRNLQKNKLTAAINIVGLCIGISAALVIYQIVQYDYSFDKYEPDRERIYRVVSIGPNWNNSGVPAPLHEAVQNKVTGVITSAAFFDYNDWNLKVSIPQGNEQSPHIFKKQQSVVFADANYFKVFPHQWLAGSASASLKSPYQLVLSESRAGIYFPGIPLSQVIGRTVLFNDTVRTVVSGIVKDLDAATDFGNQAFIALSTIPNSNLKPYFNWEQWNNTNSISQLFVKVAPGTPPDKVEKQIETIFKNHSSGDEYVDKTTHRLQPLSDIHFNGDFGGTASKSTLFNLMLLAVFLLLLGAINFINLSTAQAIQRAREVGVRKTLGSSRQQLILQFLTETIILTLLATILSILITPLLLKIFSGFIPEGLVYHSIFQWNVFVFLVLLIAVVGLSSGFYPAMILSGFRPALALKDQAYSGSGYTRRSGFRKVLIVTQFIIAQVFIIGMLVVNKQIRFATQKDMGFRKDAVINFYVPFDFFNPDNKKFILLNKLRAIPEIEAVSLGNQSPAFNGTISTVVSFKDGKKDITLRPDMRNGDTAYLSLYHIQLLAGRNVLSTDSATELLINETLARQLGFRHPQDALGKYLEWSGRQLPIVGVMADFNLASVRTAIHPLIYYSDLRYGYIMHVGLQGNMKTWSAAIDKMKTAWKEVYPDMDFDYSFLDKTIESFYKQDKKVSGLLSWSAGIAIFISCLGLLGLVIFTANQRIKEIGIRKVLGASVAQIISLLSKDFLQLVALAFLIAVPIAWWAMHKWLQNFAYHTTLSWWIFIISGGMMLLISLLILSLRAGKAALANPVKSLRTE